MGKQGLGVYATSYRQRFDTVAHVLHYPQRPLVTTKTAELIGRDLPNGQNAIVAIMCFSGYNQGERSLLVSINAMHSKQLTRVVQPLENLKIPSEHCVLLCRGLGDHQPGRVGPGHVHHDGIQDHERR
jgi:hypothetical protein